MTKKVLVSESAVTSEMKRLLGWVSNHSNHSLCRAKVRAGKKSESQGLPFVSYFLGRPRHSPNLLRYILTSNGVSVLPWDSAYSFSRRRSFLSETPTNVAALQDPDHFVVNGTFMSVPSLFRDRRWLGSTVQDNWHLPLIFGLSQSNRNFYNMNIF